MAETKKITKREALQEIIEIGTQLGNSILTNYALHEIELLDKKVANAKMTKTQEQNEELKKIIVETLEAAGEPITIKELQAKNEALAPLSNQKISNLLTQLVKNNDIVRTEDKKRVVRFSK